MKKGNIFWSTMILVVLLGIFNMFCFWILDRLHTTCFWISIGVANASIIFFGISAIIGTQKAKYQYFKFHNILILGGYSLLAVILNFLFILFKLINIKVNIIINILVFAPFLIFLCILALANGDTQQMLEKDRKERNAYYDLKDKAEGLLNRSSDWNLNKKIESMYDKICSCQINRGTDVSDIDSEIIHQLNELTLEIDEGAAPEVVQKRISRVMLLVDDRNRKITNTLKR